MGMLQTLLALVVLIYVLCVIVQGVQEVLKSFLNTKATIMARTLFNFMGEHLLTPEQIATALKMRGFDSLAALEHFSKDDFRSLIDTIPFTDQQAQILADAKTTAEQFKDHAAASYDAAMAKFQKSYAANNKKWVIGVSFGVVLLLNASVIKMYEVLAVDQKLSQTIAGTTSSVTQQSPGGGLQPVDLDAAYSKSRQVITDDFQKYPILLRTKQYPIDIQDPLNDFGLIIMGILVSLGAPFWNDILKGTMGLNNVLNTAAKKN
ncbi:MAG TPA: hypothetical protein VMP68_22115 [Candidatus Eisenbacteria bacterium]|nr:hypothetical protein [Candidatus Eisenbacteria bacterium]